MNAYTDTLNQIDAPTLMGEIKASLDSTAGLLEALALSREERADQARRHPGMTCGLDAGHLEAAAAYLAEEVRLVSRLSALLLDTRADQGSKLVETSSLSSMDRRRLASLTKHPVRTDTGEAIGTLLGGLTGMARWLTANIEHIEGLDPAAPALILIGHRLESIEAHSELWVSMMMSTRPPAQGPAA
ncbi:hypothetical protein [Halomonas sp. LBP4]|uniref:hypothetical protein n=1 Tax=Halomonas sp. LBP4 TaxID=2044917 RepID=UPI000D76F708|nr:hypothetical protein [Halomonas sp. LBP4]PXX94989.1 hypothetical protein CR157_20455 [Halomonas sp. LBP4]